MAESIAAIVLKQLANLIDVVRNHSEGGLGKDLELIKAEFERMTAFLRVADALQDKDPEVAVWVKQVREIAHDTEDVLDEYGLLFLTHRGRVERFFSSIKNVKGHSRLATKIRSIKSKVCDVSEGHQRYRARYEIEEQAWKSGVSNYSDFDGFGAAHLQDEPDLAGIQKQKGELVSLLLDGHPKVKIVAVFGMGGLGRATLVRKIYEDKDVRSQFQLHAWVTVSIIYDINELLKAIIKQFCGEMKEPIPQEVQSMNTYDLAEFVKYFIQGRNYIIVFEDLRDINSWEAIKYALSNGNSHSRVLCTTRRRDLAVSSFIGFRVDIYQMDLLSPEDSWSLLCNRVFKEDNCPSHLKDISEKILRKCGGLPLAIVVIGGVLASKGNGRLDDWEMIYRSIGVELEDEGALSRIKRILFVSFFHLPHNLKVCLLYLSIFPQRHKISCNQLIRLWIAEGFVEERDGLTMEEVGQSYLNKLVNGSLMQVVETTRDGRLRTCRIHNILRDIIVLMSKKENVATVAGGEGEAKSLPNKVRRLAIHGPLENSRDNLIFKHLRSLVLFSPEDLPAHLSKMLCGGSRVVKVLDLRGAQIEVIPEEVFKLYLLEYLSLRSTKVKVIPKSIGKLRKLETLDLKNTFVTKLPVQILNLQRLRYLIVYHNKDWFMNPPHINTFRAPYKIGCLMSLQKLCFIEADEKGGVKTVREIRKLAQLRRLGIKKLRKEDGKDFCSSLERLTNLRSLAVGSIEDDEMLDLQYNLCPTPNLLRTLKLVGRLEKIPQWIPSLQCLTKLFLRGSRLKEEPLQYFEDLPNLVMLSLNDAYEGEDLHFKTGKFMQLNELELLRLNGLRKVRVEASSMPCLEGLFIAHTKLLEELPSGIEYLSNLQCLHLLEMAEILIVSLQNRENRSTPAKIRVGNLKNGQSEWQWVQA